MTDDVTRALAILGVAGQVLAAVLLVIGLGAAFGMRAPLDSLRRLVWGYELWLAFATAAIATGGSLYFSEITHYVPCELCWFQRICMYPLSIVTLLAALANDHRVSRYLLPLPVVGGGISIYHLLVEHGVVTESQACFVSAPGGCATKWIDEFGYVTIPVLALTGFALTFAFLALASWGTDSAAQSSESAAPGPTSEQDGPPSPTAARAHSRLLEVGIVTVLALVAGGGIGWAIGHEAGGSNRTISTAATTPTDPRVAKGKSVFASAACGVCHTLEAAGSTGTAGPDLNERKSSLAVAVDRVTNGKGAMPSFRDRLSTEQIRDVAAFVAAASG